jgi:hypothetical protein
MSTDKIDELVNVLNGEFSQIKLSDTFLSKLPDNSWKITVSLQDAKIVVESFRNDSILIENNRYVAADEMYWYSKVIPVLASVLAQNLSVLSKSQVIRFIFKNEEGERIFICEANELASLVTEIRSGDFGAMMAIMQSE